MALRDSLNSEHVVARTYFLLFPHSSVGSDFVLLRYIFHTILCSSVLCNTQNVNKFNSNECSGCVRQSKQGLREAPRPPLRFAPEITGPCVVGPSHAGRAGNWSRSEGRGERGVENSRYIDVITESAPSAQQTKAADYDGHRVAPLD